MMEDLPTAECELCGKVGSIYNKYGQQMYREYYGTIMCSNHHSQAKWPETYREVADCVVEWIDEEMEGRRR